MLPIVHYWADFQLVHGLRCYDNITRTRNVSEYMLVLALCLVKVVLDLLFTVPTIEMFQDKNVDQLQ